MRAKRVLVYGPYPPAPGPEAAATLATVRTLLGEGATVEVVSPLPSGAHHHADVMGLRGSLAFGRCMAGSRPDDTVAHLDPGLLRPRRGGRKELAARRLLGLALRGATVHLGELSGRLDPAYVAVTLGSVARITVSSAGDREALVSAGVDVRRVTVDAPAAPAATPDGPPPPRVGRAAWNLGATPTKESLEAEIRRRASADRTADLGRAGELGPAGTAPSVATDPGPPDGPLSRISPYHAAAPVGSPRLVARIVKQAVWRLTRFELEPVVDQVNLLHRATVEELRSQPERDGPGPTATA